ncbi:MAG: virulence factor MviN [Deltaproteobacteria bacterium]|nr:MAG: virulence factor MviN [Deltaproteobacteria bacterium]
MSLNRFEVILSYYGRLTHGSIKRKIFGAVTIIALLTLVTQLASVAKELTVAAWFGTADALDAFLIAFLLPTFVINVVAGSFTAAFLPTFIHLTEERGTNAAQDLLSGILAWSMVLLISVSLLMAVLAPFYLPILGLGFSPDKLQLTRSLLLLLLPVVFFKGLSNIWAGVLNAGEHFALPAMAPIFVPLFAIIFILIGGKAWGIFALVFGTVIGFGLETCSIGYALRLRGILLRPRFRSIDPDMRIVIGQYLPVVAGGLLMGSTELVDKAMAGALASGSVASLNYGNKVITMVLGLAAMAIGTAVLPYFSRLVAERGWDTLRSTLHFYLRLIFVIAVPVAILIYWLSEPLVRIIFQRGAFTGGDTALVAAVQAFFSFQIPFYIAGIMLARLVSSLRANHILMWAASINITANVGFNILFIHIMGLKGIALSTSIVYAISFLFLWHFTRRLISEREKGAFTDG